MGDSRDRRADGVAGSDDCAWIGPDEWRALAASVGELVGHLVDITPHVDRADSLEAKLDALSHLVDLCRYARRHYDPVLSMGELLCGSVQVTKDGITIRQPPDSANCRGSYSPAISYQPHLLIYLLLHCRHQWRVNLLVEHLLEHLDVTLGPFDFERTAKGIPRCITSIHFAARQLRKAGLLRSRLEVYNTWSLTVAGCAAAVRLLEQREERHWEMGRDAEDARSIDAERIVHADIIRAIADPPTSPTDYWSRMRGHFGDIPKGSCLLLDAEKKPLDRALESAPQGPFDTPLPSERVERIRRTWEAVVGTLNSLAIAHPDIAAVHGTAEDAVVEARKRVGRRIRHEASFYEQLDSWMGRGWVPCGTLGVWDSENHQDRHEDLTRRSRDPGTRSGRYSWPRPRARWLSVRLLGWRGAAIGRPAAGPTRTVGSEAARVGGYMGDLLCKLRPEERRGSKPRCHLLAHGDDAEAAARLTELVSPWGQVRAGHFWLPRGFADTREARLGEAPEFLPGRLREELSQWWLEVRPRASTPNWDIASRCEIQGEAGLMLVEAKAHDNELSRAGKPQPRTANGRTNHEKICAAIREASTSLDGIVRGWGLSRDTHYQLSNRFAWAWKVASLGVPVLLVYLGFLNADEMSDRGEPFRASDDWRRAVRGHGAGIVPDEVWDGGPLHVGGTPLRALIRSVEIALPARGGRRQT